jgi:hypothetical protein
MTKADITGKGVLGLAVSRHRHDDGETIWMPGTKTFQSVEAAPAGAYRYPRSAIRCRPSSGPTTPPRPARPTPTASSR